MLKIQDQDRLIKKDEIALFEFTRTKEKEKGEIL